MKRRITCLILMLCMMAVCITPAMASNTIIEQDMPVAEDISVTAFAAILMDMDTGKVLFDKDIDEKNYPASTTKIMTAYLCLKYGDINDTVTVSSHAFSNLSQLASTGGLKVGEEMSVYRLLQCLLVVSASEAANVVGEYISGSHEEFVNLMNEEAQALGCKNTHFANCHGLPNADHYTTAEDLAIIAKAAMEYDAFREIVGTAKTVMEATNKTKERTIISTNGILPGSSYPSYQYEHALGIKTGHTSFAGYCLVSAAEKDGHTLMCVILGTGSRTSSFRQTINLYEWGFENYDLLTYEPAVVDTGAGQNLEEAMLEGENPEEVPEVGEDGELEGILAEELAAEAEGSLMEEERIEGSLVEGSAVEEMPVEVISQPTMDPAVASVPEVSTPPVPETEKESAVENLNGASMESLMPIMLCLGAVILLTVILIVVLIVYFVRRKR